MPVGPDDVPATLPSPITKKNNENESESESESESENERT